MAQAKPKASAKRSQARKRPQGPKATEAGPKRPSGNSGENRVEAARRTIGSSTKEAGQALGKAASKAKVPLLAGGAALAGAAGGLAIGAMRSRHSHSPKVLGMKMPQGKTMKSGTRSVAKAAKGVGSFGQRVGDLAVELRHVREQAEDSGGRRRSPLEVLLEGLTARR